MLIYCGVKIGIMWYMLVLYLEKFDNWSSEIWSIVTWGGVTIGIIWNSVILQLEKSNMCSLKIVIFWYVFFWHLEYFQKCSSDDWNEVACVRVTIGIMRHVVFWKFYSSDMYKNWNNTISGCLKIGIIYVFVWQLEKYVK